jgi:hypothetical protein
MADVNYIEDNKINCKDLKDINQAITDMLNLFMELNNRFNYLEQMISDRSHPMYTTPTYNPPPFGQTTTIGPGKIIPWSGTITHPSSEIIDAYKAWKEGRTKSYQKEENDK